MLPVTVPTSLQQMDLTTLRAVLWDLRRRIVPSRFEKAQQPDPHTMQLGLRTLSGMVWIELSWQAGIEAAQQSYRFAITATISSAVTKW